jgi:sugar lactone lactonase YvrE
MRNTISSLFVTLLCLGLSPIHAGAIYEPYTVTTFAGWNDVRSQDAVGKLARFYRPYGVISDSAGNFFVADSGNSTIRKITPDGTVTTIAGVAGMKGSNDGQGSEARFNFPTDIAIDGEGNLYVVDLNDHTVRKITPDAVVTTLAGVPGVAGFMDGPGNQALFNKPRGVAADNAGNVFVGDALNRRIRKIIPDGVVSTFAGTGVAGHNDGTGTEATFGAVAGMGIDLSDNLYVCDDDNSIRKITPAADVTHYVNLGFIGVDGADVAMAPNGVGYVANSALAISSIIQIPAGGGDSEDLAGGTSSGSEDGVGAQAMFRNPQGITVDPSGNIFIVDGIDGGITPANNNVRKITPAGVVTTFAGLAPQGSDDAVGNQAQFDHPRGVAVDRASGLLYVSDASNNTIRRIKRSGLVRTIAGKVRATGDKDGKRNHARFNFPGIMTVDLDGNVLVCDVLNDLVRKVTPDGVVTTLLEDINCGGLAVDSAGTIWIANFGENTIDFIDGTGQLTVFAGKTGQTGRDDGVGSEARFNAPSGIAFDSAGNLFVADTGNGSIRKITPAAVVTTFAGGSRRSGNDDGIGMAATFGEPKGLAIDASDNIYITDERNHTVRKITPAASTTTLAGKLETSGYADGPGEDARFDLPWDIAVDPNGIVYVADNDNNDIRRISPDD